MLSLGFRALSLKVSQCIFVFFACPAHIVLVLWRIFPKFARRGRIRENTNVDPIFGKTNRIRSSATHMPSTEMFSASLSVKL